MGRHSQLHTTSTMKGVFFLSFATIAAGAGTYETQLLRGIDIYNDCHEMAQSWPATSLNRSPMSRMFGRQNLETFYGSESDEETAERIASIGLPENKYDAAAVSIAVLQNAMSEEEKFVERFLWDLDGDKF